MSSVEQSTVNKNNPQHPKMLQLSLLPPTLSSLSLMSLLLFLSMLLLSLFLLLLLLLCYFVLVIVVIVIVIVVIFTIILIVVIIIVMLLLLLSLLLSLCCSCSCCYRHHHSCHPCCCHSHYCWRTEVSKQRSMDCFCCAPLVFLVFFFVWCCSDISIVRATHHYRHCQLKANMFIIITVITFTSIQQAMDLA